MGSRRVLRLFFLCAAAVSAAGAIAAWVGIDRTLSAPGLKPRLEAAASGYLGRPVTIDALEWRAWPGAVLVARNFRLYEDPLERRVLLDAPVVEAHVALLSVLQAAAGVTELRFRSPRVRLRRDKDGQWNVIRFVDEIAGRPETPERRWGRLAFNWFVVEGGTVTVEDESGGLGALPPVAINGRGKLRLGRRHPHFPFELTGRLLDSPTTVALTGDLGGRSRLHVELKDGQPSLARLLWPPAARWSGRWDGTLSRDERRSPDWELRARAAPLVVSSAAPRLDSLDVSGEYASASSFTFSGTARSSATEVSATGSVDGGALKIDVESPKADLDALWALARAAGGSPGGAQGSGIELRDVRAVVRRSTGPYTLERLSFRSLGGSIEASGSYSPSAADDALKFSWKASSVDVQELFRLAGSTHEAAGLIDLEGRLATSPGVRFLPALTGTVAFDFKNGWFDGMPGLLKVLGRLNLATLFAEASGRRGRVPFDEARGAVKIAGGRVTAEKPIVLENKTLQLAFMGDYDLPARTVNGRIVVNFLTVTDEIIGLIPGVRDILLGGEKGLIPIWLSVKGKADDPDVDVLSARTIAAPVWNTVRHILRLPKKLYDGLAKPPLPPAGRP